MTIINGKDNSGADATSTIGGILGAIGTALLLGLAEANHTTTADGAGLQLQADSFGQLMRLARAERGMSLRELSRLTDVAEMRLEWYEQDDTFWKPSFDEVVNIRKALGISADSIKRFL